jgi:hypothetical protein
MILQGALKYRIMPENQPKADFPQSIMLQNCYSITMITNKILKGIYLA